MLCCPREPRPGEPISASWMRELVRYVKAITPIAGPHVKVSTGPNGSVITGTPGGGKTSSAKNVFPWHIEADSREETVEGETVDVPIHVCADCYYMAGQLLRKYTPDKTEEAIEDFVCQGELSGSEEYTEDDKPFLCFRYKSALAGSSAADEGLIGYKTYALMLADMTNRIYTVIPLYLLTHAGSVKLDFRATPSSQEFEIA